MWVARATSLFVVTFLALDSMLASVVDLRGGSEFIKPYHSWNMVFCSAVSVCILEITYRVFRILHSFPWLMQWLGFVHIVIIVIFLALPLGDRMAIRHERTQGPPMASDMGYGWYYWDDSGMGGNPITGFHLLLFVGQPFKLGAFLFGSASIFALAARSRKYQEVQQ